MWRPRVLRKARLEGRHLTDLPQQSRLPGVVAADDRGDPRVGQQDRLRPLDLEGANRVAASGRVALDQLGRQGRDVTAWTGCTRTGQEDTRRHRVSVPLVGVAVDVTEVGATGRPRNACPGRLVICCSTWAGFCSAAAAVIFSPPTSPSQLANSDSAMRSCSLAMMSRNRSI